MVNINHDKNKGPFRRCHFLVSDQFFPPRNLVNFIHAIFIIDQENVIV